MTVIDVEVDHKVVVAAGVMCLLFGLTFVVLAVRPHPDSEAGSLTGGSAALVKAMGIGTGVWLILTAFALFGHDPQAALDILMVFAVLYGIVSVVLVLALLVGGLARLGGVQPRDSEFGPEHRPPPRSPHADYYRYFR